MECFHEQQNHYYHWKASMKYLTSKSSISSDWLISSSSRKTQAAQWFSGIPVLILAAISNIGYTMKLKNLQDLDSHIFLHWGFAPVVGIINNNKIYQLWQQLRVRFTTTTEVTDGSYKTEVWLGDNFRLGTK